ncbi:beta-ketoadipate pathway transcriptional regulator, PcaR/PcaU/PobR family [compost metagenome]
MRPLHVGAPGKAILAFLSEAAVAEILRAIPAEQERDQLKAALRTIRRNRYAISLGELVAGGASVAAPVFDRESKVVGSVALAIPQARLTKVLQAEYIQQVLATAGGISVALGCADAQIESAA